MTTEIRSPSQGVALRLAVLPKIGNLYIDKITPRILQAIVDELSEKYTVTTVKLIMTYVSVVLQYAYELEIIDSNPCQRLHYAKSEAKEKEILTIEEAQKLLTFANENLPLNHYIFYLIAIYGGLRRGEIAGLKWCDVDFERNEIHIIRTACYMKEYGVYTNSPKTKRSERTVSFPHEVMKVLRTYQAKQIKRKQDLGDAWKGETKLSEMWLFTNDDDKILSPQCFTSWTYKDCELAGVKKVSPHSFRHLNASLLIRSGEDVTTVSACLGTGTNEFVRLNNNNLERLCTRI